MDLRHREASALAALLQEGRRARSEASQHLDLEWRRARELEARQEATEQRLQRQASGAEAAMDELTSTARVAYAESRPERYVAASARAAEVCTPRLNMRSR